MPAEKFRGLWPRQCGGVRPVVRRTGVAERMGCAGVAMKLMPLIVARKFRVEFAHVIRRRILVVGAKMSLNRATDFARAFEWRWTFTERHHRAAAVEHYAGL